MPSTLLGLNLGLISENFKIGPIQILNLPKMSDMPEITMTSRGNKAETENQVNEVKEVDFVTGLKNVVDFMLVLMRMGAWVTLVIVFAPLVFSGLGALVLFFWGSKMSPWLSYCRGGLYRMYLFVYYPVRVLPILGITHEIIRRASVMGHNDDRARKIRLSCKIIASVSLLYLIPAGLSGCDGFEAKFMRQKELWPQKRQVELPRFLDSAFPGQPMSALFNAHCRSYNGKWISMLILACLSLALSSVVTQGKPFSMMGEHCNSNENDWIRQKADTTIYSVGIPVA